MTTIPTSNWNHMLTLKEVWDLQQRMMASPVTVFYGGRIYSRPGALTRADRIELPDGAILYLADDPERRHWYSKDLTPIPLEDVPKALRAWVLILP